MYDYRVPRQNAKARLLALLFLMLSIGAFVGSAFTPYPAILQCVGLACLFPMIQIVARYMAVQYLYRLRPYEDGNVDFEVYAYRGGARMQLVCRVGLEEITAVAPLSAENKKAPSGIKRYGYQMDIAPEGALVVSITNGDGDCELLLVPDAYIEEVLREAAGRYVAPADFCEGSAPQEEISDK
jgi:hypothetical protein